MDKKVSKKNTIKSNKTSRKTRPGPRARNQHKEIVPPWSKPFPIIAIGASAGGLEAFTQLLSKLPVDTGMAFIFVQHLAPSHESLLTDLLAKATKMPVREVIDGMRVEPDHAYVIPPKTSMAILNGVLHLMPREVTRGQHMTVDFFLHSLADDQGDNAIAVILSGTGSDGASGIRAIKTEGGIVFAQDEKTAKYSSMPQSAVATGCVDFVMPPEMIAKELLRISRHPYMVLTEAKETEPVLFEKKEDDLSSIFILLRTASGVDFTGYKRSTIKRRIMRRLLLLRIEKLENYLKHLQENPSEVEALYQDILINVTRFFRDPETFNALKSVVFPKIIKKPLSDIPIRIWVPGCSTGEEAYSIAICLLEFLEERRAVQPIQIFATDVDETAIEKARKGVYPESITADISPERLRRFFVKTEKGFQISKSIREICIFARHNLIKDPPFSRMDFICCRNLLIYFGLSLQEKAISRFHYALNPNGFLLLGTSETTGKFSNFFSQIDKKQKIYSKKAGLTRPDFDISAGEYAGEKRIGLKKPEVPAIREIKAEKKADLSPIAETKTKKKKPSALKRKSGDKDLVRMRHELAATREQLKSVISAHEASNEELQALNEEMQSSNEELQSVNEELETSQEELQSTNEELVTVNDELLDRNAELTETSNDLINILSGVQIPVILLGNGLQIRRFNDTAAKLLNLIPTDIGRAFSDIRTNIDLPDFDELILDVINTLHTKALDIQDLKGCWYSMTIRPYKTLDNRIEGVLISLVDINDRKISSIRLKESMDYAKAIVETVREPLIILNGDLRVRSANDAFYHIFQTKPEETENFFIFSLANGRWDIPELRKLLEEVLASDRTFEDFQVELDLPNTGRMTVLLNARRIYREEDNAPLILLAMEDTTKHNCILESLRESRENLSRAQAIGNMGWWRLDIQRNVLKWSDENYHIFGLPLGTPLTYETFLNIVHPDDRQYVDTQWKAGLRGEPYDIEHRIVADEQIKWVREKAYLEFDEAGQLTGGFGITHDITNRKNAEESLRASKERYRSFIEVTGELGWTTNPDGEVIEDLPFWRKYTGQTYEEIKGTGWAKALHPDDVEHVLKTWEKAVTEKSNYEVEYRIRRHDGLYRHFMVRGIPVLKEDGSIWEWVGTCIDITERKQLELEKEHLASFPRLNPNPVIETSSSGNIIFHNNAAIETLRMLGINEDVSLFLPDDIAEILKELEQKSSSTVYRVKKINENYFGENIYFSPEFNSARIYVTDITERKKAEEALRSAHKALETRVTERTFELARLNEELENEKRQIKIINKLLKVFVETTSRKEFLDEVVEVIKEWCNCSCLGIRILDEKGNIPYESSIGFSKEFLNSESMISVQKDQCACIRAITGNAEPQDLSSMTEYGSFFFNNTFEFLNGLSDAEKTRFRGVCVKSGYKSLAIIPIRHQKQALGLIHIADESENKLPINEVKFIETMSHIIGEAIYKFNAEEELRESREQLRNLTAHLHAVREEERTTIAREIHDELGQIMTAIKMDLSWLKNNYGDHETLSKKTESMMVLIDETIRTVRRIITELRPGILDHLGISASIEWQADEFKKLTGIPCNIIVIPEEIILSKELSINIFRIFQEILTNIMRHAEATSVNALLEQKDGKVILKVQDNGKGITEEELSKKSSFGIMGMRERVNYISGSLKIEGMHGEGTTIEVIVPTESSSR